jgi:hypothetical protein
MFLFAKKGENLITKLDPTELGVRLPFSIFCFVSNPITKQFHPSYRYCVGIIESKLKQDALLTK